MFGIAVIEVAIGLVFAYIIFSSICSGLFELFARIFKMRARHLENGLKMMLQDPEGNILVQQLYKHQLIGSEFDKYTGKLQWVGKSQFATAMMDILAPENAAEGSQKVQEIRQTLEQNKMGLPEELRVKLLNIVNKAEGDVVRARKGFEDWFDHNMWGLSAWYKRKARLVISVWAIIIVGLFNADTIRMAKVFWNDDELRESISNAAANYVQTTRENPVKFSIYNVGPGEFKVGPLGAMPDSLAIDTVEVDSTISLGEIIHTIDSTINQANGLPVGWGSEVIPPACSGEWWFWFLAKIAGLIFTTGAVTLGAPYWFDALKKLLSLRAILKGDGGDSPKSGGK